MTRNLGFAPYIKNPQNVVPYDTATLSAKNTVFITGNVDIIRQKGSAQAMKWGST